MSGYIRLIARSALFGLLGLIMNIDCVNRAFAFLIPKRDDFQRYS